MMDIVQSFYQSHGILTLLIVLPLLGAVAAYLSGERNAKRVALWVGFATPQHFSEAFKRQEGESPGSFRQRGR